MKKRGFTLIELLAVIVVLAIIIFIAIPIVVNLIENAQKGAAERSTERYLNAVEHAVATDRLENGLVPDGMYTVNIDGNLVLDDKIVTVEVNGDSPLAGSRLAVENGQVVSNGTRITIGNYTVTIDDKGAAKANPVSKGDIMTLCTAIAPIEQPVYDWRIQDKMVSEKVGSQATTSSPYKLGAVYSCDLGDGAKTFYVLKVSRNNVKLIMNQNLGKTVAWSNNRNNSAGPVLANEYLANQTSGWDRLRSAGGTVSLPEAQDIADAIGDTEWTDNNVTGTVGPDWLRVNLYGSNGPLGYWTSTPYAGDSKNVWRVSARGYLTYTFADDTNRGVRPVITISKANMSL